MIIKHLNPRIHDGLTLRSFYVHEGIEQRFEGGMLGQCNGRWYVFTDEEILDGNRPIDGDRRGFNYSWQIMPEDDRMNVVDIDAIVPLCPKETL